MKAKAKQKRFGRLTGEKVPVSERALVQRVNRKLAPEREVVKKARGQRMQMEAGTFYRIDLQRNFLVESDVDLEALGRDLGVLNPWESLEEPGEQVP